MSKNHATCRIAIQNKLAVAAAMGLLGMGSTAMAQVTAWNNPGSGDWNPGPWTVGVPNGAGFHAVIDGNPGQNSGVVVNGSFTVGTISISPGDQVTIPGGGVLSVNNVLSSDGTLLVNGTGGPAADLRHDGGTLIVGGSNIRFTGANARMLGSGTVNNLTLISGGGQIGVNGLFFINTGSVVASESSTALVIDPANTGTAAAGFVNSGTLLASGGTLTLTGNGSGFFDIGAICRANADSQIRLINSADLRNGTLTTIGNGTVAVASGHSASLTNITNAGNISIENSGILNLAAGTFTNNGSININAAAAGSDLSVGGGSVNLVGSGVVNLNGANARLTGGSGTLVNNTTIQGVGQVGVNAIYITNNSLIQATSGTMTIDPINSGIGTLAGLTNNGSLLANGGVLLLTGSGSGFINNSNGRIIAGSTDVQLIGNVDIRNGTLTSSGTGVVRVTGAGNTANLTNVTNIGNLVIDNGGILNLGGTFTNAGSVNVNAGATSTDISVGGGSTTLAGSSPIDLNGANARITGGAGTLNNNTTIRGTGQVGANAIYITNNSLIQATTGTVIVDPINSGIGTLAGLTNNGSLLANGAVLSLTGFGSGFFNNANGRIIAGPTDVQLVDNVDIRNGTLTSSGAGVVRVPGAGNTANLTNVTNVGNLAVDNGGILNLGGTLNNTGTVNVNAVANATDISVGGASLSLAGTGFINLNNPNARLTGGSGTLANNTTIQGMGQIGVNSIYIVNNSLIRATTGTITIDPINSGGAAPGFLNVGTVLADGGILALTGSGSGFFDNASRIIAGSTDVQLVNSVDIRNGTLTSSGTGVVRVTGAGNTANLTNVTNIGNLVIDNGGILNLGATFTNTGSVNVNAGATATDINIGGASLTLAGASAIDLNGANARITGGAGTLNNNTTIRGVGQVGVNTIYITNNSLIQATTGTVIVDPINSGVGTLAGLTNNGSLLANGAVLSLTGNGAGFFNNSNGRIIAGSTDVQLINNVDIRNGTLTSSGAGVVRVPGAGNTANLTNVTNVGNLVVDNGGVLNVGGTLTNNGTVNVNAVAVATDINVGGGSASLAGTGFINLNGANARIVGGSGTVANNTTIQGQGHIGINALNVINNSVIAATTGPITLDSVNPGNATPTFVNNGVLRAAGGTIIATGSGAGAFAGAGSIDIASNGTFIATTSASITQGRVVNAGRFDVTNSSDMTVQNFRGAGTVNVNTSATLRIAAGGGTAGTSTVGVLAVTSAGRLDITNHDLAIDYTGASPVAGLRPLIASAFTSGTWGGTGLTSSNAAAAASTPDKTGIGYAEATDVLGPTPTTFSGVTIDSTTAVVRYTLLGDANLDLTVDIGDFSRLAAGFNTAGLWSGGDFNYDGTINIGDFSLLASNFNKVLPADLPRGSAVPEPTAAMLAAAGTLLLARRRRTN